MSGAEVAGIVLGSLISKVAQNSVHPAAHCRRLLSIVFNAAVRLQVVGRNPVSAVEMPRPSRREMRVMTPPTSKG